MTKPTIGTTTTEKTDEQILKLAIEKAIKNGFKLRDDKHMVAIDHLGKKPMLGYESIIFSHDFAKAFFGDEAIKVAVIYDEDGCKGGRWMHEWQRHLQLMVLEENPIRYLERFLNDKE